MWQVGTDFSRSLFVKRGRLKEKEVCDGVYDGVHDGVCDVACDSVTELCGARPELIMTGPGAVTHYQPRPGSVLPSLSCPWGDVYILYQYQYYNLPHRLCPSVQDPKTSKHSKQFASLCAWQVMLRLKTGDCCCCWLNTTSSVGRACVSVFPWSVDYNITPGTQRHA